MFIASYQLVIRNTEHGVAASQELVTELSLRLHKTRPDPENSTTTMPFTSLLPYHIPDKVIIMLDWPNCANLIINILLLTFPLHIIITCEYISLSSGGAYRRLNQSTIQFRDDPILQKFHVVRPERPDLHLPAAPRHPRDVRLQLHDQVGEEDGRGGGDDLNAAARAVLSRSPRPETSSTTPAFHSTFSSSYC